MHSITTRIVDRQTSTQRDESAGHKGKMVPLLPLCIMKPLYPENKSTRMSSFLVWEMYPAAQPIVVCGLDPINGRGLLARDNTP